MKKNFAACLIAGITALSLASQTFAAATPDQCRLAAETATGVYDLAIRNGSTPADAAASAQSTFKRRIQEDSGNKISSMTDALDECKAAGISHRAMCVRVEKFYTDPPC